MLLHDVALALFGFFLLLAWLGNTPYGRQLLLAERFQWLALLMQAMWLAAIADVHRGAVSKLIGVLALLALPLHVVRVVQMERTMWLLQRSHTLAIEAGAALAPGSLVLPVMAGADVLLQHREAYVAAQHSGILITANEGLVYKRLSGKADARLSRIAHDPHWIMRHWRTGIPLDVDQILFMGHGIDRVVGQPMWRHLLADRWRLSFDNGYARIYTAVRVE